MSIIMDGYNVAKTIRQELKDKIFNLSTAGMRIPKLTVIIVGDDPASKTYVNSKHKLAKEIGMLSEIISLPETINEERLIEVVENLNSDKDVDGILIQLPLPDHIDSNLVIETIDPSKDVDGLTAHNVAMLSLGREGLRPCTPLGIIRLLDYYNVNLEGSKVMVIGRSRLVGKPVADMLLQRNATVTIAHSKSKKIDTEIANHDIIIVAVGKQEIIPSQWIQSHHVLVDVGIHRNENGKLSGDVDSKAYSKAAFATPVPKGVGPMTIAMLLENTYQAYLQGGNHE